MNARSKTTSRVGALAAISLALAGCPDGDPPVAEGIFGAMGEILPSATEAQREAFERGRAVAERRFTVADGLGPTFNVTFCGSCHEKPVIGGSAPRYRNFLLVGQQLPDGSHVETGVNGVQPIYRHDGSPRVATEMGTNVTATRNGVPFFGAGLIAEIPGENILEYADPDDEDGDGISGRPNYDRGFVGRFGRKAQTVSLEGFIRGPLNNHVGITSNPLSDEMKNALPVPSGSASTAGVVRGATAEISRTGHGQAAAPDEPLEDDDDVADPELSAQDLFDLVSFAMLLAAPRPDALTAETESGSGTFEEIGCTGCHVRGLESPRGLIPIYSDLLLHDMGEGLADGIPMKEASASEFKTQPLWGLAATGPYLHDGRADTIDEAILAHGGEAEASRVAYEALDATRRAQVLAFLRSLGGADQASSGLLAPDAAVPAAGEYGGPDVGMSPSDMARFERGREVFDRDRAVSAGLGPLFNGDSCRACHFEPTIGGAGPVGVNVLRHGYVDGQGQFSAPNIGTMAYRLGNDVGRRAPADLEANVFEMRQTPPLYGFGRIDGIPESEIVAGEDPEDMDGDGIRGIAHRLPDGRLGRFGWKANVPSVAEFARDAISNEVGLTVPEVAGHTFGFTSDGDDVADPEVSVEELDDLSFFMAQLAPPPRRSTDADAEARGQALFSNVGCDACHSSLADADGNPVMLYSDLLLHDVAPAGFVGIPDGAASGRHFRTPPLWGLGLSGPYMHDGLAFSIEQAIARHDSEGAASRDAFEMLSGAEREDLLKFLQSL